MLKTGKFKKLNSSTNLDSGYFSSQLANDSKTDLSSLLKKRETEEKVEKRHTMLMLVSVSAVGALVLAVLSL